MKQVELGFEAKPRALRVSELVKAAGRALEVRFSDVWVEGEISNLRRHASGHLYFCLKDSDAQLPCVLFRTEGKRLRFAAEDGLSVRCRGRLSIYEAQGRFQLYVQSMEPVGLGALQLALEQLRGRLAAEGLFDAARKRALPKTPRTIGVVTNENGAALRDIVRVLHRRASVRIVVSPAIVQGDAAPASLLQALALLERFGGADVIIIGRGGGSTEDLWAFNDERLVRAVAACRVPIISAVGHEVDVTLCDFAADLRAPTPSAAAELAIAVERELRAELGTLEVRLARVMGRILVHQRVCLDRAAERLSPRRVVQDRRQALDDQVARLRALHPKRQLELRRASLERLEQGLKVAMHRLLERRRRVFESRVSTLDALSPLRVLDRGYAIAQSPDGHAIRDAAEVEVGGSLELRLSRGKLGCVVKSKPDP